MPLRSFLLPDVHLLPQQHDRPAQQQLRLLVSVGLHNVATAILSRTSPVPEKTRMIWYDLSGCCREAGSRVVAELSSFHHLIAVLSETCDAEKWYA